MAIPTLPIYVNANAKSKEKATKVLKGLGISMSTAINMLLDYIAENGSLPFKAEQPKSTKKH